MITIDIVLLFQFLNVLLLLFLLNTLLYKPIRSVMRLREEELAAARDKTVATELDVQEQIARYEQKLRAVRSEALDERNRLLQDARQQESLLQETARREAADHLALVQSAIRQQEAEGDALLRDRAHSLSRVLCEKIIGRRLS